VHVGVLVRTSLGLVQLLSDGATTPWEGGEPSMSDEQRDEHVRAPMSDLYDTDVDPETARWMRRTPER
jgi:hypothetical protein